ncbi:MAG TPA: response regulator transcription factor [Blastocatellia bacterium]|nr:response regulator transcription factor [Blastocatellia bacterium]HMZ20883.1 response regulator transcription factor [Blastocatellia bacterium]
MKLLIVEDNLPVRRMLRQMVVDLAEEISECGNGTEAVTRYHNEQPDCVVMDIHLPGINGLAATAQITTAFPAARVFVVTGLDEAGVREAAFAAGASGFVLKENMSELRQHLRLEITHGNAQESSLSSIPATQAERN